MKGAFAQRQSPPEPTFCPVPRLIVFTGFRHPRHSSSTMTTSFAHIIAAPTLVQIAQPTTISWPSSIESLAFTDDGSLCVLVSRDGCRLHRFGVDMKLEHEIALGVAARDAYHITALDREHLLLLGDERAVILDCRTNQLADVTCVKLLYPRGAAIDHQRHVVYVSDSSAKRLLRLTEKLDAAIDSTQEISFARELDLEPSELLYLGGVTVGPGGLIALCTRANASIASVQCSSNSN